MGMFESLLKTLKVSLTISQLVRRDSFARRDEGQRENL